MKNAVIISPNDSYGYNVRTKYLEEWLKDFDYQVTVYSADFDHRNKRYNFIKRKNLKLVHVPSYKRNLSLSRIISHFVFSKKMYNELNSLSVDLVYCSGPPNFLYNHMSRYKQHHNSVKMIYEIGDLWPETLPVPKSLKVVAFPFLSVWAYLRNNSLKSADHIIYECKMFSDYLTKYHSKVKSDVIYLSKEDYYNEKYEIKKRYYDTLRFAYVGSINNIIDIDFIIDILKKVGKKRKVCLVVIGGGENADKLFKLCDDYNINYENYGIIYDDNKKHDILCSCHLGLNIMKESVAVGATMKSLEYFHEGLALINNIPYDTMEIVNNYNCGYNINYHCIDEVVNKIIEVNEVKLNEMQCNSRKAYDDYFSVSIVKNKYIKIFKEL